MSPSARKILIALSTSLLLGLLTACSKQGEGERCDSNKAGHSDCEDGLVCTNLSNSTAQPNDDKQPQLERCCPPLGGPPISDDRCNSVTPSPSGTAGSSSGGSGGASEGGMGGADAETTVAGSGGEPTTGGTSGSGGGTNTSTGGTDASSGAGGA